MNDLRAAAAAVVAVRLPGPSLDARSAALLRTMPFAGFTLFAENVASLEAVRELTDALRSCYASGLPPVIAIDQEGGPVVRLHAGVERIPSMMALGAVGDALLAQRVGEQIALDLRRAGVNVNFAPVLDVTVERNNTVIGTRSFGSDPDVVTRLGGALAKGLSCGGIVPTYKHFPGHGSTEIDSHLDLPAIDIDEVTFRSRDLAPFMALLPGAPAVMTAHILLRALDPRRPATLSPHVLTDLLRTQIGFAGVCFTDSLHMQAIVKYIGVVEGAIAALAAGADCVLLTGELDLAVTCVETIVEAVEDGTLSEQRLVQAAARMATLRASLAQPLPLDTPAVHRGVGREAARRAVTLVRGEGGADATACLVISFESVTDQGAEGLRREFPSLVAQAPALLEWRAPLDPEDGVAERILERLAQTSRRPILLMRRAHIYPAQARVAARVLAAHPDALVVSLREPYDIALFPQARHLLCAYDDGPASIGGLADVLFGGSPPLGRLPVEFAAVR
ncbi:MAG: beta-N-acetylhexosaminidase [Vulcanimicrobiaceae bacterium]